MFFISKSVGQKFQKLFKKITLSAIKSERKKVKWKQLHRILKTTLVKK
jgi:hypothetical protein